MKIPKKLSKGERGLRELRTFIKQADISSSSYKISWFGMDKRIDECLAMKNDTFERRYDSNGYDYDHNYIESKLSILKRDNMYVYKDKSRCTSSEGKVSIVTDYVIISADEKGVYSVMEVTPSKNGHEVTLNITANIGTTAEEKQTIDLTRDIPKKSLAIFAKAVVGINAVEDAEEKYLKAQEEKKQQTEQAAQAEGESGLDM